ncbi:MAG: SAM-dependent methyltransferase [Longicatena sp.]
MLYIVGLGAGDVDQLPIGVAKFLKKPYPIYLLTDHHPMMSFFEEEHIHYTSFDDVYEKYDTFEEVYEEIISTLKNASKTKDVIYAVPGHPCVAEYAVKVLMQEVDVKIIGGQSFLDAMFATLHIDPIDGFMMMDAQAMRIDSLNPSMNLIVPQVYDQMSASEVKMDLMEAYPDEHRVCVVRGAGTSEESLSWMPLYEIDQDFVLDNLTTLFVPAICE